MTTRTCPCGQPAAFRKPICADCFYAYGTLHPRQPQTTVTGRGLRNPFRSEGYGEKAGSRGQRVVDHALDPGSRETRWPRLPLFLTPGRATRWFVEYFAPREMPAATFRISR